MQAAGQKYLADHGYVQYEVSAYAKDGARCRHNLNYWSFGDYVGIGAGAHGKLSMRIPDLILRTTKPKQPREYQAQLHAAGAAGRGAAPVVGECEPIATAQLPFEFMLNTLRLNEGFASRDFVARTGLGLAAIEGQIRGAQQRGLLEVREGGFQPTDLGRSFLNDLQAGFLP
jgi:coproporphyrinogen III oxidase-like Fe-S oxidoreductase